MLQLDCVDNIITIILVLIEVVMMDNDICIWIDESGTLSKNPKNPQYYIYAGYWCLGKDENKITSDFGQELINFFPGCKNKEKKASSMKNRKKGYLIKYLFSHNPHSFHPVFIVENLMDVKQPLTDNREIQFHKNYLLRRFVELCINRYRIIYAEEASNVYVNIDDQSRTQLLGADPFPIYINRYFKGAYRCNTFLKSNASFKAEFRDSCKYRGIQICDVLANCKYNHYVHDRMELHKVLPHTIASIEKLP